jgi:hypothetical protein
MGAIDVLQFFRSWGGVIGLAFDIAGAIMVYIGVRIPFRHALLLERNVVEKTVDDIGDPKLIAKNESFNRDRARERVRASWWAAWGLACFVLGFALQAFSVWPK